MGFVPKKRRTLLLGMWVVLFVLMPFPQVWWATFLDHEPRTYYEALMKNLPLNGAIMGGWLWSALAERWRARRQEALSDYPGVGSPGDRSTDVRLGNHR